MCGIVGCLGNINQPEKKAFRDMLLFDVVRGQDSTGILGVPFPAQDEPFIRKEVGHPMNLWDMNPTDETFDHRGAVMPFVKVLLGHNRAATMGEITQENAHPFQFGDISGVHNGSLWETYSLLGDHIVDSKCIYDTIEQEGIDYTWERLNGAAALVWWDDGAERLYMVRNGERPLYMFSNNKHDALFWASESWMILAAMGRNNISMDKGAKGEYLHPEQLEAHKLYEFSASAMGYKLESTRTLKKWKTSAITTTTRYMAGVKAGFRNMRSTDKSKKTLINKGWAGKMEKADASMRGREVHLRFCMSAYISDTKSWSYWIIGNLTSGEKIEFRPNTVSDWDKWDAVIRNSQGKKVLTTLGTRPRLKVENGEPTYYASTDNMKFLRTEAHKSAASEEPLVTEKPKEVTLYRVFGGVKVPENLFNKALKEAGGCCAHCDDVMSLDDHTEMYWARKDTILCKPCSENPYVEELLRAY